MADGPATPEIPGQQPDGESKGLNADQIAALIGGRIKTTQIETFSRNLKDYDQLPNEQKKTVESAEVMRHQYELMIMQGIKETLKYHKKLAEQKKNGYPYESRPAELTIDAVSDAAQELEEEGLLQSKESLLWIKRMKQDSSWMASHFLVTVENSASLFGYFDVLQQMSVLRVPNRPFVSGEDLEDLYASSVEDLDFAQTDEQLANDVKIGIKIPEAYSKSRFTKPGKQEQYNPNETLGLRDLAVTMTSSSFEARMKIAAVSQVDYRAKKPLTTTFMGDYLGQDDFDFYSRLMWRTHKGKGSILAPNVVSSKREKRESEAYLEAILTTNAVERLGVIKKMSGQEKENAMSGLIDEVKAAALDRISNWRTREDRDVVSAMASLITKQGLLQDFGFMHGYRYCFRGIWNVDDKGTVKGLNEWESGSIYSRSGDLYSLYYIHRHNSYNKLANSDTPLLRPTSKSGRKDMEAYPFDKTPVFERDMKGHPDEFLREQWNFLFSNEPMYLQMREQMGYESLPPVLVDKLKSWATRYRTPFTVKYLSSLEGRGRVKKEDNYELEFPWFLPEGNGVANFFEAITAGEDKLNFGGKSVMQELIEGKKLYQINWRSPVFENQPVDRWHVDMEMSSRWMRLLIEDFDKDKDPFYTKIVGAPSTGGPKELNKRIRLWARDIANGQPEFFELAFVPMVIVLAVADKHGIFGSSAWEKTTKEDFDTNSAPADRFFREMAYWKRALKWLPSDRPSPNLQPDEPGGLKYGNGLALMSEFFERVITRIAKASAEEAFDLALSNYDNTRNWIDNAGYLKEGRYKYTINPSLSLRK